MTRETALFGMIAILLLASSAQASHKIFIVNQTNEPPCLGDGFAGEGHAYGGNFTNISKAFDTGSGVADGDEIRVCRGLYAENVTVNKSVTLRANNTTYDATINSSLNSLNAVAITAPWVNVSQLNIQNATANPAVGVKVVAVNANASFNRLRGNYIGILLDSGANNSTLRENVINLTDFGQWAVRVVYDPVSSQVVTIENNTIESSPTAGLGRGIYLGNVTNSRIANNTLNGTATPGLQLEIVSYTTFFGNRITNITGSGVDSLVSAKLRNLTFQENRIWNNQGAGISLMTPTLCSIDGVLNENHTFINNSILRNGFHGLFSRCLSKTTIRGAGPSFHGLQGDPGDFAYNGYDAAGNIVSTTASGIHIEGGSENVIENVTFRNNTGWGFDARSVTSGIITLRVVSSRFQDNGLPINSVGQSGGLDLQNANATLISTRFVNNTPQDIATIGNANYTFETVAIADTNTVISANASQSVNITAATDPGALPGANKSLGRFLNMTRSAETGYISLTYFYTDADFAASGVLDESSLRLWHYNNTTNQWARINDSVPDPANNSVYANLTNFSIVAIGGATQCNWVKGEWSACGSNGLRTRAVTETNFCGSTVGKPAESEACAVAVSSGSGSPKGEDTASSDAKTVGTVDIATLHFVAFESAKPVDLAPGAPAVVEFRSLPEVAAVKLEAAVPVQGAIVEAFRLSSRPASISVAPSGRVHSYLAIEVKGVSSDQLKSAGVGFKVPAGWVHENSIDPGTVKLNRFADGGWQSYPARLVRDGAEELEFSATIPGFSVFAISGEVRKETPAPSPTPSPVPIAAPVIPPLPSPTPRPPGFEALAAAAALGVAVLLGRRTRP